MNKAYLPAAILSLLAAIVRTIGGHFGALHAMRESTMDPIPVGFFHLTWHMVTVIFIVSAVALFFLARPPKTIGAHWLGAFIGIIFFIWSILVAAMGFLFVWSAETTIPMVVTFVIGALCLLEARPVKDQAGAEAH